MPAPVVFTAASGAIREKHATVKLLHNSYAVSMIVLPARFVIQQESCEGLGTVLKTSQAPFWMTP